MEDTAGATRRVAPAPTATHCVKPSQFLPHSQVSKAYTYISWEHDFLSAKIAPCMRDRSQGIMTLAGYDIAAAMRRVTCPFQIQFPPHTNFLFIGGLETSGAGFVTVRN